MKSALVGTKLQPNAIKTLKACNELDEPLEKRAGLAPYSKPNHSDNTNSCAMANNHNDLVLLAISTTSTLIRAKL